MPFQMKVTKAPFDNGIHRALFVAKIKGKRNINEEVTCPEQINIQKCTARLGIRQQSTFSWRILQEKKKKTKKDQIIFEIHP